MRERWALFESPALGDGKIEVRSLDGVDELHRLFRFEILLVRPSVLSTADDVIPLLEKPASLWFEEDGQILGQVHGIIAEAAIDVDVESDVTLLRLELVPRAWLLTQRRGNEIFLDRSIPEIVAQKLEGVGLVRETDFTMSLLQRYPTREFVAQHDETDWAFVSRLCEHVGITAFFEHRDGRDVIVFSDTQTTFRPIVRKTLLVRRRREHPAAYGVRTTLRRGPAKAEAHDYNYRTPLLALREQLDVAAPGSHGGSAGAWIEFGPHAKTAEETATTARVRTEELGAQRHVVEGTTTETSVRAGGTFVLSTAGDEQDLLLTKVVYRFRDEAGGEGGVTMTWENQFTAIPVKTPFRPPRVTPCPRVNGLMNAVVDGAMKGDYAELDESGRYHLRMAYDRTGRTDLGATHPVRMMQPHAGSHYGMHFPLRPGTEVLVGFVNGDPDRPIIVGTAPNPVTSSPVVRANQTQNVLRTGSNNEVVIEDERGIERIRIHTPHRNTTVQLGSAEEAEEGALTTTQANVSAASRLSNNEATARKSMIADTSTTVLGRTAVFVVGMPAVTEACEIGIEQPSSVSLTGLGRDFQRLAARPERGEEGDEAPAPTEDVRAGGLWSAVGATVSDMGRQAAVELVRAVARTTDTTLDDAIGRAQGEPLGQPMEPAAIVASAKTAAMVGREVGMVFGDRVASLSSYDTACVAGQRIALVKSPKAVEIAAGEEVKVTTAGELGVEAKLVRMTGGYYPEAEAPPLDDGTSIGVMSRRDLRLLSVEDCILVCAKKNVITTAHTGDVRVRAKQTVSLIGGSIAGSAGTITLSSSGNTKVEADGDVTVSAAGNVAIEAGGDVVISAASVTIEAGTITLSGAVTVDGDLTVTGSLNGG